MRGMKCLACWLIFLAVLVVPLTVSASAGDGGGETARQSGESRLAPTVAQTSELSLRELEELEQRYEELGALWEERAQEYALRFEALNRELATSLAEVASEELASEGLASEQSNASQEPDPERVRQRMEALEARWETFGERFEELGEGWAEWAEELGERLEDWGEEYGERWEERGEAWGEQGEAWGEHWAEWGEQFADHWSEFGDQQADQWEEFGEHMEEAFDSVDWDAFSADLEEMTDGLAESLETIDWEGFGDWLADAVEDAVSTALEAAERAHEHDGR